MRMTRSYKKKIITALIAAAVIILLGVGYRSITRKMNETGTAVSADDAVYPSAEEDTGSIPEEPESTTEPAPEPAENEPEEPAPLFNPEDVTWIQSTDLDIDTLMSHPEVIASVCKIDGGSDYLYYISEDLTAQKVTFTYNEDIAVVGYVHKDPMNFDLEWTDEGTFILDRYGAPANLSEYDLADIVVHWYLADGAAKDDLIIEWEDNDMTYTLILEGEDLSDLDAQDFAERSSVSFTG